MGLIDSVFGLGKNLVKIPLKVAEDVLSGNVIDPDKECKTPKQVKKTAKSAKDVINDTLSLNIFED